MIENTSILASMLKYLVAFLLAIPSSSVCGDVLSGPVTNNVSGHVYYLLSQNTWPVSEAEATELGGHLVTIDDQAENDWVFSTFASFGGQPRCLWIGYRRREIHSEFVWASGASTTFTNWSVNEPNDFFYGGEPEHFAFMWDPSRTEFFRAPSQWNDVPEINAMDGIPICGVVELTRPRLFIQEQTGGMRLGWTSHTNKFYQLEYRAAPPGPSSWTPLGGVSAGNGSTNHISDTAVAPERFYRVREIP